MNGGVGRGLERIVCESRLIDRSISNALLFSRWEPQPSSLLAAKRGSHPGLRIGVSRWCASRIRQGYRPHPRHWLALAKLVGVSEGGRATDS